MSVELRHLRYFIALAEAKSWSRGCGAWDRAARAEPADSIRIQWPHPSNIGPLLDVACWNVWDTGQRETTASLRSGH